MIVDNEFTYPGQVKRIVVQDRGLSLLQTISSFTETISGVTEDRYLVGQYRYTTNGVVFSEWKDLKIENLENEKFGDDNYVLYFEVEYTRQGSDSTGIVYFEELHFQGEVRDKKFSTKFYDQTVFSRFFEYDDNAVLGWMLNVFRKLYQTTTLPSYISRKNDFSTIWLYFSHIFAILVYYSRFYEKPLDNRILTNELLSKRNIFYKPSVLQQLNNTRLIQNQSSEFLSRGTNRILENTKYYQGELLRLINYQDGEEFIFNRLLTQESSWYVDRSSPCGYNVHKGNIRIFPTSENIEVKDFPVVDSGLCSIEQDTTPSGDRSVLKMEVFSNLGTNFNGFVPGGSTNFLPQLISPSISYDFSTMLKVEGTELEMEVGFAYYDRYKKLIGVKEFIPRTKLIYPNEDSKLQEGIYYQLKITYFSENYMGDLGYDSLYLGDNQRLTDAISYIFPIVRFWGNGTVYMYDCRFNPRQEDISLCYINGKNVIESWLKNNSDYSDKEIVQNELLYLLPYSSILVNNFYIQDTNAPYLDITPTEMELNKDNGFTGFLEILSNISWNI